MALTILSRKNDNKPLELGHGDKDYLVAMVESMVKRPECSMDDVALTVLRVTLCTRNTWQRLGWMLRKLVQGL